MASGLGVAEPRIRKNAWIGWLIGGSVIILQGGCFLGVGIISHLLSGGTFYFNFSLFPFSLSFDLPGAMIIGGLVATIVGVLVLGYGVLLHRRERAWDQKMG